MSKGKHDFIYKKCIFDKILKANTINFLAIIDRSGLYIVYDHEAGNSD